MSIAFDELESLNAAIAMVTNELKDAAPGTDEFAMLSEQLSKVTQIKQTLVTLMLKEQELVNKKFETELANSAKTRELELKDRDLSQKKTEHEETLQIRERELELRKNENFESFELKSRELDMKKADAEKPDRVSKETWALIGANLAGIVAVLGYERANVVASKAFGLIFRR